VDSVIISGGSGRARSQSSAAKACMMNEIQKARPKAAGRSSRPVITNNAIQMRMVPTNSDREGADHPAPVPNNVVGSNGAEGEHQANKKPDTEQHCRRDFTRPAYGEEQADHHSHRSGQQACAKQDSAQSSMDRIVAAAEPVGELEGSATM
jgi:hypothetical protein